MNELACFLKDLREEEGQSISEMARKIGISCNDIYAINRGNRELTKDEVKDIIDKYKLDETHLYLLKNITRKGKVFEIICTECGSKEVSIGVFDVASDIVEFRCRNCKMIDVINADFY